jgi:hypothetical protein
LEIAQCLEGLAGVISIRSLPEKAARLFGAAEALRQAIGALLPSGARDDNEREVSLLRSRLGEAKFSAVWAESRAMTMEQAIADALDDRR